MAHVIEFGLKIMEHDPNTKSVVSVHCQFCVFKDREERHPEKGRKRKNANTVMNIHFNQRHLAEQHWERRISKMSVWLEFRRHYAFKILRIVVKLRWNRLSSMNMRLGISEN